MLKIGILGMGRMGWLHAAAYSDFPDVKLVAIADRMSERLDVNDVNDVNSLAIPGVELDKLQSDIAEVRRYSDASQLIDEASVDVIDICLPTFLHARFTAEALKAKCHVLCEKPMALTIDEASKMIEASKRADRLLMIGQCVRFWPEYQYLRQCVQKGTFGRLLSLNMWRIGGRPTYSWNDWFQDSSLSGGTIHDLHIHDVDYVNHLFGMPNKIQATACKSEATGSYDIIHAFYNYNDGPQVHLHAGWSVVQFPFTAGYEAWFERAFIRYSPTAKPAVEIFDNKVSKVGRPAEYEKGDYNHNVIAYFLNCIKENKRPVDCLPESTRDSLALVEKEITAIETAQTVSRLVKKGKVLEA